MLSLRSHELPASIGSVDGARYVAFMSAVRAGLNYYISSGSPFALAQRQVSISTTLHLRCISPIRPNGQLPDSPNTIGKVLDNIMRNSLYEE